MSASALYLKNFFDEKDLDEQTYTAESPSGETHIFTTGVVIEAIMAAPTSEQDGIAHIIRQIDFRNGNVHHFLNHLAQALAAKAPAYFS